MRDTRRVNFRNDPLSRTNIARIKCKMAATVLFKARSRHFVFMESKFYRRNQIAGN